MGMYSMIEDAQNARFAGLIASGMTDDEATQTMLEEDEAAEDRLESRRCEQ